MNDGTLLFLLAPPRTDPARLRERENQPAEWSWLVSTAAADRLDSLVFHARDRLCRQRPGRGAAGPRRVRFLQQ